MKETTHANATAKTAFGCRKGLTVVPLIGAYSIPVGRLAAARFGACRACLPRLCLPGWGGR